MDKIIELGISDIELKEMLEQCPSIVNISNEEIDNLLGILKYVGCNDRQIRNVIICNPYYLERTSEDVLKLIMYLRSIGLSNLDILFDMNPFLLNKDDFEIKEYVNKKISSSLVLEDIVDKIESNPYVIDEEE